MKRLCALLVCAALAVCLHVASDVLGGVHAAAQNLLEPDELELEGAQANHDELEAWRQIEEGKYIRARELAQAILAHDKSSFMGQMVLGKEDFFSRHPQMRRDNPAHPHLFTERILHRLGECTPGSREGAQRAGEYPIKLQHRTFVEDYSV